MTAKTERIDVSPLALAARLEQLRALYKLMVHLRRANPMEPSGSSERATRLFGKPLRDAQRSVSKWRALRLLYPRDE